MHRRTRAPLLAALLAAALTISGCALQAPTPVTDLEARARFVTVLDETQQLVGGDWQLLDDPTPRTCVIALGVVGQRYPALRIGSPPRLIERAADQVEEAWLEAGMSVTRTALAEVIEVKGETAEGELVVFRVSAGAMTLLGESECRPL